MITRVNEPDASSTARARQILDMYELAGVPSTLSSAALELCKDKAKTHAVLLAAGIPTPATVMPTSVDANTINAQLEGIEPNPRRPIVIKTIHGTKGIGVALASNRQNAIATIQMLVNAGVPVLAQYYVETRRDGAYRDIRHDVVDGAVEASMMRKVHNDFRANLSLNKESMGGISDARGSKMPVLERHKELSLRTAEAIGASILGVDILPSIHGGPMVGDVNGSPGFRIMEITKKNLAAAIARYAIRLARYSSM